VEIAMTISEETKIWFVDEFANPFEGHRAGPFGTREGAHAFAMQTDNPINCVIHEYRCDYVGFHQLHYDEMKAVIAEVA
jgi:hypothetical protein